MRNSITEPNKKSLRLWAVAFWLAVWQAAAMLVGQELLLASPLKVLIRFFELAVTADFWRAACFSLARIALGYFLGMLTATLAAVAAAHLDVLAALFAPLIGVIRAIPVASFVIVALIWVPSRNLSVLISFLIVLPVIYTAVLSELKRRDPALNEMARVFSMPLGRRALYISALPLANGFCAACTTAIGLAWKSGTAAELISIPAGSIGERLYKAKVYLMTGDLFAWTLLIVLLSALCARLFSTLIRLLARKIERM